MSRNKLSADLQPLYRDSHPEEFLGPNISLARETFGKQSLVGTSELAYMVPFQKLEPWERNPMVLRR
jgi:hypothetical protein